MSSTSRDAATTPERHPATAKAWEWFETDPKALALSEPIRLAISERLQDLDTDFIEWDRAES